MIGKHITGRRFSVKIRLLLFILCIALCLSSCTPLLEWIVGDGRGDWTLNLIADYYLVRSNAHNITISFCRHYSAEGEPHMFRTVLAYTFVTAYEVHDPYICVEGIPTEKETGASDEELESLKRVYYLLDTTEHTTEGPFETFGDFFEHCKTVGITPTRNWVSTKELNYQLP
ncbi:MAG: hypothetical protein J6J21_03480 [Clostridia bacterium]|nr:hypothetical protein [Clostridia bacterium]